MHCHNGSEGIEIINISPKVSSVSNSKYQIDLEKIHLVIKITKERPIDEKRT